jgi:hypothetical protein
MLSWVSTRLPPELEIVESSVDISSFANHLYCFPPHQNALFAVEVHQWLLQNFFKLRGDISFRNNRLLHIEVQSYCWLHGVVMAGLL